MLSALLARRSSLPILGKGAFGKVYEARVIYADIRPFEFITPGDIMAPMMARREEVRVLKVAVPDGSADWIEWCYLRMKQFGEDSIEMDGLPRVYEFERIVATDEEDFRSTRIRPGDKLWACVMERYDYTASEWREGDSTRPSHNEFARKMEERYSSIFGQWFFNDMHGGNIMWSIKRGGFILTDPSCSESSGRTPRQQPTFGSSIEYSRVRVDEPVRPGYEALPGCGCAMCKGVARGPEERAAMRGVMGNPFGRAFQFKKFGGFSVLKRRDEPQFRFDKVAMDRLFIDEARGFQNIEKAILDDMMRMLPAKKIPEIKAEEVPPGPGRQRKVADWKKPGLQRLHHMR